MTPPSLARWERWAVAALVLWAGVLRIGWLGTNSFSFDEARVSAIALQMARAGDFAELGMQSSTGVPNFPAATWLFAIPYALTPDPLFATFFACLIGTLAVWGIWWLARQAWDGWVALGVGLLFTAAPFIVFYSRSIWAQNLLPPLAILWAITAVHGISRGDWRTLTLHAFLSGFVGQVHLAGIALALGSLWLGLIFRLWRHWRPVTAGIILGILAATPTLYTIWRFGDGAQADIRTILDSPSQPYPENFSQLFDLAVARGWEGFWLNSGWIWGEGLGLGLSLSTAILIIALGLGTILTLAHFFQNFGSIRQPITEHPAPSTVLFALLPIWAVCAPLFFYQSRTPVLIQYQLASVPALFLLIGAAVGWLPLKQKPQWLSIGFAGLALGIALFQTAAVVQTLNTISEVQVEGGMGTPLNYSRAAANALTDRSDNIVIHSIGNNPAFDGDAAVFDVLLWGHDPRLVDGRTALLIPAEGGSIFATFDTVPAWQTLQRFGDLGLITPLPRRSNEPPYMSMTVDGAIDLSDHWQSIDVSLENGATLIGWRMLPLENGRIRLETVWSIGAEIRPGEFQQFNHLYATADETKPTFVSDGPTSSLAWRSGDTLVTWAEFDPPADGSTLLRFDVGMYTWPDLQRSPVLGRDGDPLAPIQLIPQDN